MTSSPINVFEFESRARELLSQSEYDFVAGGAADEITIRRSRQILDAMTITPRMLRGVEALDMTTTLLGTPTPFPIVVGPAGFHGRVHREAELATVRGAGRLGALTILSSGASYTLEEVANVATGPIWYQ